MKNIALFIACALVVMGCVDEVLVIEKQIDTVWVEKEKFIDRVFVETDTIEIPVTIEVAVPTRVQDTIIVNVTDTIYIDRVDTVMVQKIVYVPRVDSVFIETIVYLRDTIMVRDFVYGDTLFTTYGRGFFQIPDELMPMYLSFFETAADNGHELNTGGNIWVEYTDLGDAQGMSYTAYGQKFLKLSGKLTTDQSYVPLMREMSRLYLGTQYSADPENLRYPFHSTSEIRWSNRNAHKEKLKELFR